MEYRKKTYPEISDEILDTCRNSVTTGTYEERISLWKKINAALWGEGTPFDISKAWEKISQNSEAYQEAKEAEENARSAEQQEKEKKIRINFFVAWLGMRAIIFGLICFFGYLFYLKVWLPFLEWWDGVVVWYENHQTAIFLLGGFVVAVLISLKIFPIIRTKK